MVTAREIGDSLVELRPELAWRVDDAVYLVEAGNVWRAEDGSYDVFYATRYYDGGASYILSGRVTLDDWGYHCDCFDHSNDVVGWHTPYTPRLELEPGMPSVCCCHVLAVHIARTVEAAE